MSIQEKVAEKIAEKKQFDRLIEELGQREFRRALQRAARKTLSEFPTDSELKKMDAAVRETLQRMYDLAEQCTHIDSLKDPEALIELAKELCLAKQISEEI